MFTYSQGIKNYGERKREELTYPGVQTAPGLAPAREIYLISFFILCFETQNTMIRAAQKKWEGGRLEKGGQQCIVCSHLRHSSLS